MSNIYIGRGFNNTAITTEIPRGFNNTARGINSVTKNLETKNLAIHLAEEASAGDRLDRAIAPPAALSGEQQQGLVAQEQEVSDIPARGIKKPAQIVGIDVQLAQRSSSRPKYHVTMQFDYQLDQALATKITIYTYPHDRLREYRPMNPNEQDLLELGRLQPHMNIGRAFDRNSKTNSIQDIICWSEIKNGIHHLCLIYVEQEIEIVLDQQPTLNQSRNYQAQGHWGMALQLNRSRRQISIHDATNTGDHA